MASARAQGLAATCEIHRAASSLLENSGESGTVSVPVESLKSIRLHALRANRAMRKMSTEAEQNQSRLEIELHLIQGILKNEAIDEQAHKARVLDLFRKLRFSTDGATTEATAENPLTSLSASHIATDKAIATLHRLQASANELAVIGHVNTYGRNSCCAKNTVDSMLE